MRDADSTRSPTLISLIRILLPSSFWTSSSAAKQVFPSAAPRTPAVAVVVGAKEDADKGAVDTTGAVDATGAVVTGLFDGRQELGDTVGIEEGTIDGRIEVGDTVGAVGAVDGEVVVGILVEVITGAVAGVAVAEVGDAAKHWAIAYS